MAHYFDVQGVGHRRKVSPQVLSLGEGVTYYVTYPITNPHPPCGQTDTCENITFQ